jgi:hypothetical protein
LFQDAAAPRKCSAADRRKEGTDRVSLPDQQHQGDRRIHPPKIGGTLVPLELETPYPTDYNATAQQVERENETGYLPPLKTKIDRIEKEQGRRKHRKKLRAG